MHYYINPQARDSLQLANRWFKDPLLTQALRILLQKANSGEKINFSFLISLIIVLGEDFITSDISYRFGSEYPLLIYNELDRFINNLGNLLGLTQEEARKYIGEKYKNNKRSIAITFLVKLVFESSFLPIPIISLLKKRHKGKFEISSDIYKETITPIFHEAELFRREDIYHFFSEIASQLDFAIKIAKLENLTNIGNAISEIKKYIIFNEGEWIVHPFLSAYSEKIKNAKQWEIAINNYYSGNIINSKVHKLFEDIFLDYGIKRKIDFANLIQNVREIYFGDEVKSAFINTLSDITQNKVILLFSDFIDDLPELLETLISQLQRGNSVRIITSTPQTLERLELMDSLYKLKCEIIYCDSFENYKESFCIVNDKIVFSTDASFTREDLYGIFDKEENKYISLQKFAMIHYEQEEVLKRRDLFNDIWFGKFCSNCNVAKNCKREHKTLSGIDKMRLNFMKHKTYMLQQRKISEFFENPEDKFQQGEITIEEYKKIRNIIG